MMISAMVKEIAAQEQFKCIFLWCGEVSCVTGLLESQLRSRITGPHVKRASTRHVDHYLEPLFEFIRYFWPMYVHERRNAPSFVDMEAVWLHNIWLHNNFLLTQTLNLVKNKTRLQLDYLFCKEY